MNKTLTAVAAVLLGIAAVGVGTASLDNPASATKPDGEGEHKVWVCHATAGEGELKNGYNLIHVDVASTQYKAHEAHATTDPKVNRKHGEAPNYFLYDYLDVRLDDLPGKCGETPPPEPVVVEVVPPTVEGPDCDTGGVVNVPEVVGLVYTRSDGDDGVVTVTVEAAAGYVLAEGSTTSWTFPADELAQWPASDPRCTTPEPVTPEEPEVGAQGPVPPVVVETPTTAVPTAAPAAEVTAAPSALPTTGSSTWAIFLIGMGLVMTGAGLVTLSRRYV